MMARMLSTVCSIWFDTTRRTSAEARELQQEVLERLGLSARTTRCGLASQIRR